MAAAIIAAALRRVPGPGVRQPPSLARVELPCMLALSSLFQAPASCSALRLRSCAPRELPRCASFVAGNGRQSQRLPSGSHPHAPQRQARRPADACTPTVPVLLTQLPPLRGPGAVLSEALMPF